MSVPADAAGPATEQNELHGIAIPLGMPKECGHSGRASIRNNREKW